MFCRSVTLWKQTLKPPRRAVPLALNPLTRWSRALPAWSSLPRQRAHLDKLTVGFEGCHSAFNATNAIRTCLFFGTREAPVFLTLDSWRSIAHAQAREEGDVEPGEGVRGAEQWAAVAQFGEAAFLHGPHRDRPLVALENFCPRAESVLRRRVPHHARLLVGHENLGVSARFLGSADANGGLADRQEDSTVASAVVYIPQYGTISSLNVVASTGIALFYTFLDQHFPDSRVLASAPVGSEGEQGPSAAASLLQQYQTYFQAGLPTAAPADMTVAEKARTDPEGNCTPRMDPRPLHPVYFKKDVAEITVAHRAFREALLAYSNTHRPVHRTRPWSRFGLSVLYENDFDTRNFGGLIRNANAFLVDAVCYLGRRRVNRVGAVGSYHYTPPVYLGPVYADGDDLPDADGDSDQAATERAAGLAELEQMIRGILEGSGADVADGATPREHEDHVRRLAAWSLRTRGRIEEACGGPSRFWFLDCGHRCLYDEDLAVLRRRPMDEAPCDPDAVRHCSSQESLAWYRSRCEEAGFVLSLCDTDAVLAEAAGDGVVLLVPQEGKLPHLSLLLQCERILAVRPDTMEAASQKGGAAVMRGLPSQVASAIALQRLSTVLHPAVKSL